MRGIPLVRAATLVPFLQYLDEAGVPTRRLLEDAGLPEAVRDRPALLLPAHLAMAVIHAGAASAGIAHLGLRAGGRTPIGALGVFGENLLASATLHEALHTAVRLQPLFGSGGRLWLRYARDQLRIHFAHDRRIGAGLFDGEEFAVAMVLHLVGTAAGTAPAVDVFLRTPDARGLGDVALLANARVIPGAPCSGVGVPRALLPLRMPAPAAGAPSRVELERRMLASAVAVDFAGSVQQAVGALMLGRYPGIQTTAHAVGLTVRTLQRRLADGALSYSKLVDRERHERAMALLADPGVRITDISIELGYADLANFTHAFHRWTGMAPRAFRAQTTPGWPAARHAAAGVSR